MITVTKEYDDEDPGLHLVEFKSKRISEIYVAEVKPGPFFKTGESCFRFVRANFSTQRGPDFSLHLLERTPRLTSIFVFNLIGLDRGDKILSINGKKHPNELRSVEQAMKLLDGRAKSTVFVMRPDRNKDDGYKYVMGLGDT
jgi:hypothetical protein